MIFASHLSLLLLHISTFNDNFVVSNHTPIRIENNLYICHTSFKDSFSLQNRTLFSLTKTSWKISHHPITFIFHKIHTWNFYRISNPYFRIHRFTTSLVYISFGSWPLLQNIFGREISHKKLCFIIFTSTGNGICLGFSVTSLWAVAVCSTAVGDGSHSALKSDLGQYFLCQNTLKYDVYENAKNKKVDQVSAFKIVTFKFPFSGYNTIKYNFPFLNPFPSELLKILQFSIGTEFRFCWIFEYKN